MPQKCNPRTKKSSPADRVLSFLDLAQGWVSGEELAKRLGVSRAAVAKHVAALRVCGHVIHSRTHKGYFLELRAERIERELVERDLRTRVLGRGGWRILDEAESTNTEAITWALAGAPEGAIVTAERQSGGKGRKGHAWFSSPRGLSVSIILRPKNIKTSGAAITRCALKAMREAIALTAGLTAMIKEPNDLYLDGGKICGVLAESGMRADELDWLILGAGCNVNVLPEEFPAELRGRVTSLYAAGAGSISKNELLGHFLTALEPLLSI